MLLALPAPSGEGGLGCETTVLSLRRALGIYALTPGSPILGLGLTARGTVSAPPRSFNELPCRGAGVSTAGGTETDALDE